VKLLFLFILFFPLYSMADTIIIVGDAWCPYNCTDQENPGFLIQLAQTIFKKSGHTVQYSMVPWKRAKMGIRDGTYDAIVGMSKNEETENLYVFPTIEMAESQFCFYAANDSQWKYTGIPSLKNVKLGVINGYGYDAEGTPIENYLKDNINTTRVEQVSGDAPLKQLIQMLLVARVSVLIADSTVIKYTLTQMAYQSKLKNVGCLENVDKVHIAFSAKNPHSAQYAKILSNGIKELKQTGEYDRIIDSCMRPIDQVLPDETSSSH
jgi:polar amino acid transport system substrate-binding protein